MITAYDSENTQRMLESQLCIRIQVRDDEVECLRQKESMIDVSESSVSEQLIQSIDDLPTYIGEWPEDWQEAFEERAAIMEYDGGLSRDESENEAEILIREEYCSECENILVNQTA